MAAQLLDRQGLGPWDQAGWARGTRWETGVVCIATRPRPPRLDWLPWPPADLPLVEAGLGRRAEEDCLAKSLLDVDGSGKAASYSSRGPVASRFLPR